MSVIDRIEKLEALIRSFPSYIDNWEWFEENFDILKTIPNFRWPNGELQRRWEKEK